MPCATAVEVKTSNRHTDLCFADGRPEKSRTVGVCEVAGAFAYYSTDSGGLRQASLTGGTLLSTPEVRLKAARRERTGKVVKVDYAERRIWIDRAWPAFDRRSSLKSGPWMEAAVMAPVTPQERFARWGRTKA